MSYNIDHFKEGDIITRVEVDHSGDDMYMGKKLTFLSKDDYFIYVRPEDYELPDNIASLRLCLTIDNFYEGWDYYKSEKQTIKDTLRSQLQKALYEEDYEFLAELRDIFNKITT